MSSSSKNRLVFPLVVLVVTLLVAALSLETVSFQPGSSLTTVSSSSVAVVARAIDPNDTLVVAANYTLGQELLLSVTVPDSSQPVSLHQIFNGHDYGELSWNVASTHYTYVIDSGPADPSDLGLNQMYAVVTFANGSTARSNNVTMEVAS